MSDKEQDTNDTTTESPIRYGIDQEQDGGIEDDSIKDKEEKEVGVDSDDNELEETGKKKAAPKKEADKLHCKIIRQAKAPIEMKEILQRLDGEGEPLKKSCSGRTKKKELETILNTTHSIKTFAEVDDDKQKFQENNIKRIKAATFQIEINSQDAEHEEVDEIPELQFISICKYSNLVQNDLQSVVYKMNNPNSTTDDKVSEKADDVQPSEAEGNQGEGEAAVDQQDDSKTATEDSKVATPVADLDPEPEAEVVEEPPVVKKQKVSETGQSKVVVAQAVDEYANAITVQGATSSEQSSPSPPKSAAQAIQEELQRARAAHADANQNKEPSQPEDNSDELEEVSNEMDKLVPEKKKRKEAVKEVKVSSPISTQKSPVKSVISKQSTTKKTNAKISVSFTEKKGKKGNSKIAQKLKDLSSTVDVQKVKNTPSVEQIDIDGGSDDICNDSTVDSRN